MSVGYVSRPALTLSGCLRTFSLKARHALQFAQVGIHIEVEIEFQHLLDVRLDIDRRLLRIDTACQVLGQNYTGRLTDILGLGMRSEGVPVGNKEHTVVLVLHLDKTLHRTEIVTQVQVSGRTYSTNDAFHL